MDARAIVRRAAEGIRSSAEAKNWLLNDESGGWERQARELLERHEVGMRLAGLSEAQMAERVALELGLSALRAILERAKKDGDRGGFRRGRRSGRA